MYNDIKSVLISEERLDALVGDIARRIDAMYSEPESKLVLLCILKGSAVFTCDLMRRLTVPAEIEFMRVSSYGSGTESSGEPQVILDIDRDDIHMCDILVVEDIIDTGNTLSWLTRRLREKGARSVRTCTLLDKPDRRTVEFVPDITGEVIPDEFAVGYGLDYNECYRTLPFVGILKPEIYEK